MIFNIKLMEKGNGKMAKIIAMLALGGIVSGLLGTGLIVLLSGDDNEVYTGTIDTQIEGQINEDINNNKVGQIDDVSSPHEEINYVEFERTQEFIQKGDIDVDIEL